MNPYTVTSIAEKTWCINESDLDLCYLVEGEEKALLIDTGTGIGDLEALVRTLTDKPLLVAATHGHGDHLGGAGQFPEAYVHPADIPMAEAITVDSRKNYVLRMRECVPGSAHLSGDEVTQPKYQTKFLPLEENSVIDLGGRKLTVYYTPGHTEGSVSFHDSETGILFSGDAYNRILLLILPGEDRKEAVRTFLSYAERIREQQMQIRFFAGGHDCPVDERVFPDLIGCANGILNGSLTPKRMKIHIFDDEFYRFGKVLLRLN